MSTQNDHVQTVAQLENYLKSLLKSDGSSLEKDELSLKGIESLVLHKFKMTEVIKLYCHCLSKFENDVQSDIPVLKLGLLHAYLKLKYADYQTILLYLKDIEQYASDNDHVVRELVFACLCLLLQAIQLLIKESEVSVDHMDELLSITRNTIWHSWVENSTVVKKEIQKALLLYSNIVALSPKLIQELILSTFSPGSFSKHHMGYFAILIKSINSHNIDYMILKKFIRRSVQEMQNQESLAKASELFASLLPCVKDETFWKIDWIEIAIDSAHFWTRLVQMDKYYLKVLLGCCTKEMKIVLRQGLLENTHSDPEKVSVLRLLVCRHVPALLPPSEIENELAECSKLQAEYLKIAVLDILKDSGTRKHFERILNAMFFDEAYENFPRDFHQSMLKYLSANSEKTCFEWIFKQTLENLDPEYSSMHSQSYSLQLLSGLPVQYDSKYTEYLQAFIFNSPYEVARSKASKLLQMYSTNNGLDSVKEFTMKHSNSSVTLDRLRAAHLWRIILRSTKDTSFLINELESQITQIKMDYNQILLGSPVHGMLLAIDSLENLQSVDLTKLRGLLFEVLNLGLTFFNTCYYQSEMQEFEDDESPSAGSTTYIVMAIWRSVQISIKIISRVLDIALDIETCQEFAEYLVKFFLEIRHWGIAACADKAFESLCTSLFSSQDPELRELPLKWMNEFTSNVLLEVERQDERYVGVARIILAVLNSYRKVHRENIALTNTIYEKYYKLADSEDEKTKINAVNILNWLMKNTQNHTIDQVQSAFLIAFKFLGHESRAVQSCGNVFFTTAMKKYFGDSKIQAYSEPSYDTFDSFFSKFGELRLAIENMNILVEGDINIASKASSSSLFLCLSLLIQRFRKPETGAKMLPLQLNISEVYMNALDSSICENRILASRCLCRLLSKEQIIELVQCLMKRFEHVYFSISANVLHGFLALVLENVDIIKENGITLSFVLSSGLTECIKNVHAKRVIIQSIRSLQEEGLIKVEASQPSLESQMDGLVTKFSNMNTAQSFENIEEIAQALEAIEIVIKHDGFVVSRDIVELLSELVLTVPYKEHLSVYTTFIRLLIRSSVGLNDKHLDMLFKICESESDDSVLKEDVIKLLLLSLSYWRENKNHTDRFSDLFSKSARNTICEELRQACALNIGNILNMIPRPELKVLQLDLLCDENQETVLNALKSLNEFYFDRKHLVFDLQTTIDRIFEDLSRSKEHDLAASMFDFLNDNRYMCYTRIYCMEKIITFLGGLDSAISIPDGKQEQIFGEIVQLESCDEWTFNNFIAYQKLCVLWVIMRSGKYEGTSQGDIKRTLIRIQEKRLSDRCSELIKCILDEL